MSMFRILYSFLNSMARLAIRSGLSKDLEIIVLRHQLTVLQRQTHRPAIDDHDRTLPAAIAAALPQWLRHGWIVTPDTLLRWHRKRVARCRVPRFLAVRLVEDGPADRGGEGAENSSGVLRGGELRRR